jgi:hypothetical protein
MINDLISVFLLHLIAFDKQNGPDVIVSALENVADGSGEEHVAEHGRRSIPRFLCEHCRCTTDKTCIDSLVTK